MSDPGFGGSKLGGLPDLSYGPVTAQPAAVPNFDATAAAWSKVAGQAEDIGNSYLKQQATQDGSQAVTKDANGNLQFSPKFPLTEADDAYNQAGQASYLAQSQLAARQQIADIQQKHIGDPQGFLSDIDSMTAGVIGTAPSQFQPALRNMIDQEAGQALNQINEQTFRATAETSKDSQLALWQSNANMLYGFARSGQYDPTNQTPQQEALMSQMVDIEANLKKNPAYGLSQDDMQRFDSFSSQLVGEKALANARSDYQQNGDAVAEQNLIKSVNDPSLNLSNDQRQQIQSQGLAEIRMLDGQTKSNALQQQQAVEYQVDDAKASALATGSYDAILPDASIRAAYAKNPARADQIIETLHGAVETYGMKQQLALATPAQIAALNAKYNPATPGNNPAPAATMPIGQAMFGQESSSGANVQTSVDGAVGPMQVTPGTWATAAREGLVHAGESIDNAQDNYAVGQRIVQSYEQRWPNDPARVATAYFSGPNNVAPPGSATPWINNPADGNRKTVSSYVGDVLGRMGVSQGSTFAAQERTYQSFQTALQQRNQALATDPATYVLSQRPDIATALSSQDPATVQNGVRSMIQAQGDLGVSNPQVLTAAQKTSIMNSFSHPAPAQTGQPPVQTSDNMIGVLQNLQQTYGPYYPQVFGALSKDLPPEVVGLDWTKDDPAVAARMANAVNTGRTALDKILPTGASAPLDQAVSSGLSDFNATVKGFGGSALTSKMGQAVGLYARQLVAEGVDPGQAGEQAVQDVIGKNYTFQDGYRVPTGINSAAVGLGVTAATNNLSAANVEPYAAPSQGVSVADRQTLGRDVLKNNGAWITLPNDGGLALTWGPSTGYIQARDAKGAPIQYTWPQLTALGQTQKGTPPANSYFEK